jgi:hypothetical protein
MSHEKIHLLVYRDTTFGGCGVFSSKVILPGKGKEQGEGSKKTQIRLKHEHACIKGITVFVLNVEASRHI